MDKLALFTDKKIETAVTYIRWGIPFASKKILHL